LWTMSQIFWNKFTILTQNCAKSLICGGMNYRGRAMSNTKFTVSFTLKRDNEMREHDETFFDVQHIRDEIESWLTDLDFVVSGINIKERETAN